MAIPPFAVRFLTPLFYYQIIKGLFVNIKNGFVKIIFLTIILWPFSDLVDTAERLLNILGEW